MKNIHHIATGGTIDSAWDPAQDTAVPRTETIVPEYLEQAARVRGLTSETLFLKDSRQIKTKDKRRTAEAVCESGSQRVILTSGTYLMHEVASRVVEHPFTKHFEKYDRRVVTTGSIVPIEGFEGSDGGFNLGMSYAVLESSSLPRITLTMNGRVFDPRDVEKDLTEATFTAKSGTDLLDYETMTIIPVGGSIDFEFDGLDGFVPAKNSFVAGYLRDRVKTDRLIRSMPPLPKDSRELTDEDIATVVDVVLASTNDRIVITMGVYKVQEVAAEIRKAIGHLKESLPTIGITGGRLPLKLAGMTDSPFNLGYTCGHIGASHPGVHVCFGGHVFDPEEDVIEYIYTPSERAKIEAQGMHGR